MHNQKKNETTTNDGGKVSPELEKRSTTGYKKENGKRKTTVRHVALGGRYIFFQDSKNINRELELLWNYSLLAKLWFIYHSITLK